MPRVSSRTGQHTRSASADLTLKIGSWMPVGVAGCAAATRPTDQHLPTWPGPGAQRTAAALGGVYLVDVASDEETETQGRGVLCPTSHSPDRSEASAPQGLTAEPLSLGVPPVGQGGADVIPILQVRKLKPGYVSPQGRVSTTAGLVRHHGLLSPDPELPQPHWADHRDQVHPGRLPCLRRKPHVSIQPPHSFQEAQLCQTEIGKIN
ncbi:uncharacterized protein LOC125961093 isoform X2 [Orcinus orca]|uniref:uncharacterized protein LOC125961093 isoform X2 n=1 Tax=Orcinus orca TaxID=9733 RepID=UPI00211250E3|nr:uncharacterized protein LOC125961093 isoform X2 [Orcinus orca]